jgi:hypothetical protein
VGFLLLIAWIVFLFPKTFVDIKLILGLLFLPSLFITLIICKKVLGLCGYTFPIRNYPKYNAIIAILAYFLITIPIGNMLVIIFLSGNYFFAQKEIRTIDVLPYNIGEQYSRHSHRKYTHVEVEYSSIKKRINIGNRKIDDISNKILRIKISKGFFGYYIIKGYKFQDW